MATYGKNWSFPVTDGTLQKILKVFNGEELHIDPVLTPPSPLNLRGERGELPSKTSERR